MQPELLPLPIPPAVPVVRCRNPRCHRVLTDPVSRVVGMGRCCAETFGLTTTTTTRLRWAPQNGPDLFETNNEEEDMQVMKFCKKPVEIEAMLFDGSPESATEVIQWILAHGGSATWSEPHDGFVAEDGTVVRAWPGGLKIQTLEGPVRGAPGDLIIKGVREEFYPCKPDIFAATYERVEAS